MYLRQIPLVILLALSSCNVLRKKEDLGPDNLVSGRLHNYDRSGELRAIPQKGTLVARKGRSCLSVESLESGAEVFAKACEGGQEEQFKFIRTADSQYLVKSAYSGKCLGVADASTDDGARVSLSDCDNSPSQQVKFVPYKGSIQSYTLEFVHSKKCLDIKGNTNLTHQWTCYDEEFESQRYYIDPMQDVLKLSEKSPLNIPITMESYAWKPIEPWKVEDVLNNVPNKSPDVSNIYFFFIDTLRWDYVQKYAPYLKRFIRENIGGKQIACSPGTYHSSYAFMHSQPCQFMPNFVQNRPDSAPVEPGAFWIRALKKRDYKVHTVGEVLSCVKNVEADSWTKHLRNYFGQMSELSDDCTTGPDISNSIFKRSNDDVYTDALVMRELKSLIQSKLHEKSLYFIYLYGTHNTYKWDKKLPDVDNSVEYVTASDLFNQDQDLIEKGYINSIKSLDHEFHLFIEFLHLIGEYDKSTIVITGDHGEALGEKPNSTITKSNQYVGLNGKVYLHGVNISRELIETAVAYKFPKTSKCGKDPQKCRPSSSLYNHLDVIPTLFEGIGWSGYGKELFWGKSALSRGKEARSALTIEPVFWGPSRYMALVNDTFKVYIRYDFSDFEDFLNQKKFTVVDITNLDDQSIYHSAAFKKFGFQADGTVQHGEAFSNYIKKEFAEALQSFYP